VRLFLPDSTDILMAPSADPHEMAVKSGEESVKMWPRAAQVGNER
jgi:hypothetical protein